ncbi:DUF2782 domain-containing protein [Xanthomonadaceae bacterium JHOS43]|nr:DUF2782 domain-containing protein [Xanthomonadaceae bacterium JHOS43]MCX7562299.1 DUF2782 domain-containing protein [Xanthomonadaceae bacterium XH05]
MRALSLSFLTLFAFTAALAQDAAPAKTDADKPAPASAPLPEKIRSADDPSNAPTVTIRKHDNGDTIEEYRQNGKISMVKITPPNGIPYTLLDTNGDGLLDRRDSDGPIGPVYYTLYRWN